MPSGKGVAKIFDSKTVIVPGHVTLNRRPYFRGHRTRVVKDEGKNGTLIIIIITIKIIIIKMIITIIIIKDLKPYACNDREIEGLLITVKAFSDDICMEFG